MKSEVRSQESEDRRQWTVNSAQWTASGAVNTLRSLFTARYLLIAALALFTVHCSLSTASAATHVTATYDLGANPLVMTTVSGQPQYGLVFAQRNKSVSYNSVEYTPSVVKGYLNASGQLNDGAGNLWLDLIPNLGATPADSYYVVTVNIQGRVHAEIWVLPDVGTVSADAVRQTQPPSSTNSAFDLSLATGLLALAHGGTGQSIWIANRCVRVNSTGTSLESAADDCGTGGGGSSHALLSSTHTDTIAGSPTRGAMITGQGVSPTRWSVMDKGAHFCVVQAGSLDLVCEPVDLTQPAAVTGILGSTNGGTSTGYTAFTGPTNTVKTFTLPNFNATIEYQANKDAASGYAGLTAGTKLNAAQGQEVWSSADLTDFASKSGSGTAILGATISSPGSTQYLGWSGSNWVNRAIAAGDLPSHNHAAGDVTSGTFGFTRGGTSQSSWTASRCVRVNDAGTALESASGDCGTGGGGGDNLSVNGTAASDADFDDSTPAAPANAINVIWQKDALTPNNISAHIPYAAPLTVSGGNLAVTSDVALYSNASKTWGAGSSFNWTFDAGATDPILEFTSGNLKFSGATTFTFEGGATDPVLTPGNGTLNLSTGSLLEGGNAVSNSTDHLGFFAATTSAQLRGVLSDESGTGAAIFGGGDVGAATATTPSVNDNDTSVATTAYVQTELTGYASDSATFTNKPYSVEGTGNNFTDLSIVVLEAASCIGAAASNAWDDAGDGATKPTAACNDTGAIQRPSADFSGSTVNTFERTLPLPTGWTGNIDVTVRYVTVAASPTGNVEWDISTVCRSAGESWDASFNAAQTITDAVGSQNSVNDATQTSVTTTGCAAEEDLTLRISRDGTNDTNNDLAKMLSARVTARWTK